MSLPWPRVPSLRARLTLIATAAAALVLIPVAIIADIVLRHGIADRIWDDSLSTASRIAAEVQVGRLPDPLPTSGNGIDLIEVVTSDGRIMAASAPARELRRLSPLRPAPHTRVSRATSCSLPHGECLYVTAVKVSPEPDSAVVYAGRATPAVLGTRLPELGLLLACLLLCGGVASIAWLVAGRALRPVEAIRSELGEVAPSNPGCRVPEPPGDDEIARLARTANDALSRLERSIQQQRQFAADASHELRTPIAGIRAQLECARLHPEDTEEAVEAALRDTGRLEAIVTDLLLLARLGTAPPTVREFLDLGELLTAEIRSRPDRVPTHLQAAPGVTVKGLRPQLSRVVTNLLDNAERHAATRVHAEVGRVRDETGEHAVLSVFNDGEPIPQGDCDRIFERFYRRDTARSRTHGGTGLGLAIAREVVESHGGTIHVECEDAGVRFVVRLPLSPDPAAETAPDPAPEAAPDPASGAAYGAAVSDSASR
ncbi:sensor histidine kinase [Sphaerimonospora mesophila]|uniref:sensor histidine kinase n=1 Tax=Sphaerimonospora mesophila TaxID=37483 RepID=UPI0006E46082